MADSSPHGEQRSSIPSLPQARTAVEKPNGFPFRPLLHLAMMPWLECLAWWELALSGRLPIARSRRTAPRRGGRPGSASG